MRTIIKTIAQIGLSPFDRCRCSKGIGHWLHGLFLLIILSGWTAIASAATPPNTELTNVATISYAIGNGAVMTQQAAARITTTDRTPAQISFYSVFQNGTAMLVPPTFYATNPAGASDWLNLATGLPETVAVSQTSGFAPGETLLIRVEDFDQNIDPTVRESIIVTLTTTSGDTETLRLLETAPDSGIFIGAVLTTPGSGTGSPDGTLLVQSHTEVTAHYADANDTTDIAATAASIDPVSLVFDSTDGTPINNAKVILVHDKSGGEANVYDTDGTSWPSEVMSGQGVAGRSDTKYQTGNGEFRFPRVPAGEYRLEVIPPPGYRYPSQQTDAHIKALGDVAIKVKTGSRAERFVLQRELEAIEIHIPLDPFTGRFSVEKTVDKKIASRGDVLEYSVSAQNHDAAYPLNNVVLQDRLPPGFRYIAGSARYGDGELFPESMLTVDGRLLSFKLGTIDSSMAESISYQVRIGAGSPPQEAVNTVQGFSDDASSNIARATVKMLDELMTEEGLLIGRVFTGSCDDPAQQQAVKNARLYLENGRSVVTDERGRWHMAGVRPGTHVVQLDNESLDEGLVITEQCKMTARHVGSQYAQFVELREGSLWRVDFRLKAVAGMGGQKAEVVRTDIIKPENPLLKFDKQFAEQAEPGLEFVWPPERYVPGISSLKIAVKYPPQHKLNVLLNGAAVNPLNFEGSTTNQAKTVAISRWTGVDIDRKHNVLTAVVTDKSGREVGRVERVVHFTERSTSAELVAAESTLIADGKQRPVITVRLEDDEGYTPRPRTHGTFTLEHPHWKPVQVKRGRVELDSEFSNGRYEYTVSNDGLVRIELEPTNRSGEVVLNMQLSNGESAAVKAWLKPALRDWMMVGFVKGSIGHKTLSGNLQTLDDLGEKEGFYKKGQLSFFARGRIKGDYLLTIAYDSEKQKGEVGEQLDGVIDPDKWYTLYGDDQSEQHEAPSSSKLYLKLEKQQFAALFGDYHTDLDVTELGRYQRVLHGLKSVYKGDNVSYTAFASQTANRHQTDEIRADGTSGLYRLSREPVANSEKVVIEVWDRDHPEEVLNSRTLSRYSDYEIDYSDKTLFFKFPVSATDDEFNPVVIVVDYESEDGGGEDKITAGGRLAYTSDDQRVETGLTYLREGDGNQQTALDWRYQATANLELKAEAAQSNGDDVQAKAWLAEAEYQRDKLKVRAYAREEEQGFGLGQQGSVGQGQRKLGVESSYQLSEDSLVLLDGSYQTQSDDTQRKQAQIKWQKQFEGSQFDVGYRHTGESSDDTEQQTGQLTLGGSKEVLAGKGVLSARLEKGLQSSANELLPDRARLGLDYKLSDKTTAFVEHERVMAEDEDLDNTRVGLKATPWEGGRLHSGYVRERKVGGVADYRDYATAGLSQQWQVNDKLTVDAGYDRMQTLKRKQSALELDEDGLPVAGTSGLSDAEGSAYLGAGDDYQAVSLGASWKEDDWTASGRVEYRDGDNEDKRSLLLGMAREVDEQRTLSVQARVMETRHIDGDLTRKSKVGLHVAARPDQKGNWFNHLELADEVELRDGVKKQTSKVVNNIHYNRRLGENIELSLHHGFKFSSTDKKARRYVNFLDTTQAALRFDISQDWDVGVQGGYLHSWDTDTRSFFSGVAVGFNPDDNIRVEAGYNFSGFYDDDFDSGQYTHEGPYIDLNYRLDQQLIESLRERQ